jgi:hypothetical protein
MNKNTEKKVRNIKSKSPNDHILKNMHISSQENTLILSLDKFYKNKEYMNAMLPIVNGYSNISLRALDWFVTNYSKHNKTCFYLKSNNKNFNVHYNYKSQLKAFNKKFFDPFCRGNRIPFFYDNENCIITTIGQLNFFKWAISNEVIFYVNDNLKSIEKDMNKSNKKDTKKTNKIVSSVKIKKKNKKNNKINLLPIEITQKNNIITKKPRVKILVTFE